VGFKTYQIVITIEGAMKVVYATDIVYHRVAYLPAKRVQLALATHAFDENDEI